MIAAWEVQNRACHRRGALHACISRDRRGDQREGEAKSRECGVNCAWCDLLFALQVCIKRHNGLTVELLTDTHAVGGAPSSFLRCHSRLDVAFTLGN